MLPCKALCSLWVTSASHSPPPWERGGQFPQGEKPEAEVARPQSAVGLQRWQVLPVLPTGQCCEHCRSPRAKGLITWPQIPGTAHTGSVCWSSCCSDPPRRSWRAFPRDSSVCFFVPKSPSSLLFPGSKGFWCPGCPGLADSMTSLAASNQRGTEERSEWGERAEPKRKDTRSPSRCPLPSLHCAALDLTLLFCVITIECVSRHPRGQFD